MNCLFWNSRGTDSRSFPGLIREIVNKYKIDVLAILETRSSGDRARSIAKKLGFSEVKVVDAQGYSGGIWVLWNEDKMKIDVLGTTDQFIHLCWDNGSFKSFLAAVYASPNPVKRQSAWSDLKNISLTMNGPWCIGGDFNSTLTFQERRSISKFGSFIDTYFSIWVTDLRLTDMGCNGPFFT